MKILAFVIPGDVRCEAQQLPALRALCDQRGIEVDVVNVTERPELAVRYNVPIVPTTVLLDDLNRIHAINHGYISRSHLEAQLGP